MQEEEYSQYDSQSPVSALIFFKCNLESQNRDHSELSDIKVKICLLNV